MKTSFKTRYPLKIYLATAVGILLFVLLFLAMAREWGQGIPKRWLPMLFVVMLALALIIMTLVFFAKNPRVVLEAKGLRIGKRWLLWEQIGEIIVRDLGGQNFMGVKAYDAQECLTIKTKEEEWKLRVEDYANGDQLRYYIGQAWQQVQRGNPIEIAPRPTPVYRQRVPISPEAITFRRSLFSAFYFYLFGGAILGFLGLAGLAVSAGQWFGIVVCSLLIAFFQFTLGWLTHYFVATDTHLVVRSRCWPFRYYAFPWADVTEVSLDPYRNREFTLKVLLSNYQVKRFPSGLLKEKDFEVLIALANTKIAEPFQNKE